MHVQQCSKSETILYKYKILVQDSEDGAMTVFCNIEDHIKNNF